MRKVLKGIKFFDNLQKPQPQPLQGAKQNGQ